jgi:hypothetical protein
MQQPDVLDEAINDLIKAMGNPAPDDLNPAGRVAAMGREVGNIHSAHRQKVSGSSERSARFGIQFGLAVSQRRPPEPTQFQSESKDLLPMQVAVHPCPRVGTRCGRRRRSPRQGVPASCQGYRPGRANGGDHSRARVRERHAADTGSCGAAATRQTSAGHWRQQPFQQTGPFLSHQISP